MSWLVAIASRDGEVLNEHFGHVRHFHIVSIDGGTHRFVELRKLDPIRESEGMRPSHHKFAQILSLLEGVDAVITAQIGPSAAEFLIDNNIRVFESRGLVEDVLRAILAQDLLED